MMVKMIIMMVMMMYDVRLLRHAVNKLLCTYAAYPPILEYRYNKYGYPA